MKILNQDIQNREAVKAILRPIFRHTKLNMVYHKIKAIKARYNTEDAESLMLWFDDGFVEDFTIVYPVLKKYNMNGNIAIITGLIGQKGFLNIKQLKTMMEDGWKIASHTVTHPRLTSLNAEKVDWEMQESKKWIEENLDVEPICLVPPYDRISERETELALLYYPFVARKRKFVFHSRHFNKNWTPQLKNFDGYTIPPDMAKTEHSILERLLSNIERNSTHFRAKLSDLSLLAIPKLPEGYTLTVLNAKNVSEEDKTVWKLLAKREWTPPLDAYIFFVKFKGEIVATEYALARNGVGTLHSAMVQNEHKKHGLYRIMSLHGIKYLIEQGITIFEVDPGVRFLHPFWKSLGFHKVYKISPHAYSGFGEKEFLQRRAKT